MSGDSLPPELYAVICAFNADLLSHSLGGRTLLVQRLVELVRVGSNPLFLFGAACSAGDQV